VNGYTYYRRLRFYTGNCWRFATIPWKQRWISADDTTSIFACSFGKNGWHHLRRTLEEYDANPAIDWRDTTLHLFLTRFKPTSICDLLDTTHGNCNLPLFVYPWGTFRKNEVTMKKDPYTSRFCGPSSDKFIGEEFQRLIALYQKLKVTGYRHWKYWHTFVGGTFLHNLQGERRFVVLQGNHRFAILAHLGMEKILVRDCPGYLKSVHESELERWPLVVNKRCSPETARNIFQLFFQQSGSNVCAQIENNHLKQLISPPTHANK